MPITSSFAKHTQVSMIRHVLDIHLHRKRIFIMSLNGGVVTLKLGHLKTINFPFGTNEKLMILGVPILKHFRRDLFFQVSLV